MSSHSYTSSTPETPPLLPAIQKFFENFYQISDNPDKTDEYVESFTEDAVFTVASKTANGESEIRTLRQGMWEKVQSRLHTPKQIFPFGKDANEVMIHGSVAFELKDGRKAEVDWAARAVMKQKGEQWKMSYYQVYLDTAAMAAAK